LRSPGDSDDAGRVTKPLPAPNFASSVRTSAVVQSGTQRANWSTSGASPTNGARA
jgi:hypothetical protein